LVFFSTLISVNFLLILELFSFPFLTLSFIFTFYFMSSSFFPLPFTLSTQYIPLHSFSFSHCPSSLFLLTVLYLVHSLSPFLFSISTLYILSLSSPLPEESLNSLELLYGEAVTRTDIDGIEAEKKRIEILQKTAQDKKNKHLNSSTSAGKGSLKCYCLYSPASDSLYRTRYKTSCFPCC
jgi:hypothetical protein